MLVISNVGGDSCDDRDVWYCSDCYDDDDYGGGGGGCDVMLLDVSSLRC